MSIWDCEKPLDAMMLSHDHIAMLAVKHEQQIKDIAAHLLELKGLVTPMMEFKRGGWIGLTDEEVGGLTVFKGLYHIETPLLADYIRHIQAKLKEKNGG